MLAETLPPAVAASSAYARHEITAQEYVSGLRVAVLEEGYKRPFCKAHWSDVRQGDTVLVAEHERAIRETLVVEIRHYSFQGRHCIKVVLNPGGSPRRYESACWPDSIVYVQQRG